MKEIKNLTAKNLCFGEIACKPITSDVKHKALPLLVFVVSKWSGELKSRGVANGSLQRVRIEKIECSSSAPHRFSFKHFYEMIEKERGCVTIVDFPGLFLQIERKDEYLLLLKNKIHTILRG